MDSTYARVVSLSRDGRWRFYVSASLGSYSEEACILPEAMSEGVAGVFGGVNSTLFYVIFYYILARNPFRTRGYHSDVFLCEIYSQYFRAQNWATCFLMGNLGTDNGDSIFCSSGWWRRMVSSAKWYHFRGLYIRRFSRPEVWKEGEIRYSGLVVARSCFSRDRTLDIYQESFLWISLRDACWYAWLYSDISKSLEKTGKWAELILSPYESQTYPFSFRTFCIYLDDDDIFWISDSNQFSSYFCPDTP